MEQNTKNDGRERGRVREREKMIYERKMKRSEKYIDIEEFKREMI